MSMGALSFTISQKIPNALGRAGLIKTKSGDIKTPAFITVGTKATVKAITPNQLKDLGVQAVLGNTYHLFLQPGDELVKQAGGLASFMSWSGPTMTDSGGFQAFSLGAAYEAGGISKIIGRQTESRLKTNSRKDPPAKVTEEGVFFRSYLDGSQKFFTPEKSIAIQHNLGADIIFAFDECTSPLADLNYQQQALERTHRWAKRSLSAHQKANNQQALFGIVQGGRWRQLREMSAKKISALDFDGFGIGGSFDKEDINTAVAWVTAILPESKPRHLLGIGEPEDLWGAVENGIDTFDCVAPTRMARNGTLMTSWGRINIDKADYRNDFSPIDKNCDCYTCRHFSRAYLAHLFRAKEMLGATLASIHNLKFVINLLADMRQAILANRFTEAKETFLDIYNHGNV
jgi:queuine tRNA-ribosyltransferase